MFERMRKAAGREVPQGVNIFLCVIVPLSAVVGFIAANRLPSGEKGIVGWIATFVVMGFLAYAAFLFIAFIVYFAVFAVSTVISTVIDNPKGTLLTVLSVGLCVGLLLASLYWLPSQRKESREFTPKETVVMDLLGRLPDVDLPSNPEDYRTPTLLPVFTKRWLIEHEGWNKGDFETLDALADYAERFDMEDPSQEIAEGYIKGLGTALLFGQDMSGDLGEVRSILRGLPPRLTTRIQEVLKKRPEER